MQKIFKQDGQSKDVVSKLPQISFWLGLGSLAALIITTAIAISFEVIGAVSLFRGLVFPLSAAAVVVSLIARNRTGPTDQRDRRLATLGLVFGAITFGLVILAGLAVLIIFLPMLGV